MKEIDDTTQAHDVAVRADDVTAAGPVGVDTAMRRCAAMYLGATGHDMRRLATLRRRGPSDTGGDGWAHKVRVEASGGSLAFWLKVRALAAHDEP